MPLHLLLRAGCRPACVHKNVFAFLSAGDGVGRCSGALQNLDSLILREVKRQQLRISSIEPSLREVDVLLLGLNATESDELRQLSSSSHKGVSTDAELVVEDAARRRCHTLKPLTLLHKSKHYVSADTFAQKQALCW